VLPRGGYLSARNTFAASVIVRAFQLRSRGLPIVALGSGNVRPGGYAEFTARASSFTIRFNLQVKI
jgi:hypothetical protein